jgi:hypothetical protein
LPIYRECKNRYIFAYLKSLVDSGTFEHVYLSFLPVGHTHCDIDQMFSRIALYMRGILLLLQWWQLILLSTTF